MIFTSAAEQCDATLDYVHIVGNRVAQSFQPSPLGV